MDAPTNHRSVCLFGAAPDTGNHGVSALCFSTMDSLTAAAPGTRLTVFDHGQGTRSTTRSVGDRSYGYTRLGAIAGRRYYQTSNLWHMNAVSRFGMLGSALSPAIRAIDRADAVLDVSGGDSFTDLYGERRFRVVVTPKLITLARGRPLILLPQTYGPFNDPEIRRIAGQAVRGAEMAWARDERSFGVLKGLLGDSFDDSRHRCGVDLAFGLESSSPTRELPGAIEGWLANGTPLVGFNVSGLIYLERDTVADYGLIADYKQVVLRSLREILTKSDTNVVLVPHVMAPAGHYESDPEACERIAEELSGFAGRVAVAPSWLGPSEVKWVIGRCGWFCGTRMHSAIAALSSGVPAAAIAYSDKTLGVFETCGLGDHVHDPRKLGTDEMVDRVVGSWQDRRSAAEILAERLGGVREQARNQMELIADRAFGRSNDLGTA